MNARCERISYIFSFSHIYLQVRRGSVGHGRTIFLHVWGCVSISFTIDTQMVSHCFGTQVRGDSVIAATVSDEFIFFSVMHRSSRDISAGLPSVSVGRLWTVETDIFCCVVLSFRCVFVRCSLLGIEVFLLSGVHPSAASGLKVLVQISILGRPHPLIAQLCFARLACCTMCSYDMFISAFLS